MLKLLGISEIKGSTDTIYWPTKSDEKSDLSNLQNRSKKLDKYCKVGMALSINDNANSH